MKLPTRSPCSTSTLSKGGGSEDHKIVPQRASQRAKHPAQGIVPPGFLLPGLVGPGESA
jgi:hypothetical protein